MSPSAPSSWAAAGPEELVEALTRVGLLLFVAALGVGRPRSDLCGQHCGRAPCARCAPARAHDARGRARLARWPVSMAAPASWSRRPARRRCSRPPRRSAASVAYVTAQLSLLADGQRVRAPQRHQLRIGAGRAAPCGRDRPFRHRGPCARGPRQLHGRAMQRLCAAARQQPGGRQSERAQIRHRRPAPRQRVAAVGAFPGGDQLGTPLAATLARRRRPRCRAAGAGFGLRGARQAERPLLPVVGVDSAGEHHDCRADRTAARRARPTRPPSRRQPPRASQLPRRPSRRGDRPLGSPGS